MKLSVTNYAKTQEMMKSVKKICEKALIYLPSTNQLPSFSLGLLEEIHDIFFEKCIPLGQRGLEDHVVLLLFLEGQ